MRRALFFFIFSAPLILPAQQRDSIVDQQGRTITLSEVVIRSRMDAPGFIQRVQLDTSFYKAFRNLRILNYTQLNDIRMFGKDGVLKASQESATQQWAQDGCRITKLLEETHTGDFLDRKGSYNYYTAELYASLFFSMDTVCGEHNRVGNISHLLRGKRGLDKHKEQLKILFFNPGADIPGIPLMGDKARLFSKDHASLYDFDIDMVDWKGSTCYLFTVKARQDLTAAQRDRIVIDQMTTYFDLRSLDVLARSYHMSYRAGVYDFDVRFDVELTRAGEFLVPSVIRYQGNWDVPFKMRERGVFTATFFEFSQR
jgi:hypothetical protein